MEATKFFKQLGVYIDENLGWGWCGVGGGGDGVGVGQWVNSCNDSVVATFPLCACMYVCVIDIKVWPIYIWITDLPSSSSSMLHIQCCQHPAFLSFVLVNSSVSLICLLSKPASYKAYFFYLMLSLNTFLMEEPICPWSISWLLMAWRP